VGLKKGGKVVLGRGTQQEKKTQGYPTKKVELQSLEKSTLAGIEKRGGAKNSLPTEKKGGEKAKSGLVLGFRKSASLNNWKKRGS